MKVRAKWGHNASGGPLEAWPRDMHNVPGDPPTQQPRGARPMVRLDVFTLQPGSTSIIGADQIRQGE